MERKTLCTNKFVLSQFLRRLWTCCIVFFLFGFIAGAQVENRIFNKESSASIFVSGDAVLYVTEGTLIYDGNTVIENPKPSKISENTTAKVSLSQIKIAKQDKEKKIKNNQSEISKKQICFNPFKNDSKISIKNEYSNFCILNSPVHFQDVSLLNVSYSLKYFKIVEKQVIKTRKVIVQFSYNRYIQSRPPPFLHLNRFV